MEILTAAFLDVIVAEWRARGVPLLPPATDAELDGVFAEIGCRVSDDVRLLYTTVGGFVDYEMDGLWGLWSLPRIREQHAGKPKPFVMFADWLICSHLYCFRYENPQVSSVHISINERTLEGDPIVPSVVEFLEKLLCDPDSVWAWPL